MVHVYLPQPRNLNLNSATANVLLAAQQASQQYYNGEEDEVT